MRLTGSALAVGLVLGLASVAPADSIWNLQAVDANGMATHPKAGADYNNPANKVVVQGIALNYSDDYLDPNSSFQIYIQAVGDDRGGMAAWAGAFYQGGYGSAEWLDEYARLTSSNFKPGDLVQIEGYVAFMRGKTNINERHSADPALDFTITVIQSGVGMPQPMILPSVSVCNTFDQTRESGGELYQATWSKFQNVWIHSMPDGWGAGKTILVTDNDIDTFSVLLSAMGDFDLHSAPTGGFSVTGIFDQEALASPFTGSYRLWVNNHGSFNLTSDVVPEPAGLTAIVLGLTGFVFTRKRR